MGTRWVTHKHSDVSAGLAFQTVLGDFKQPLEFLLQFWEDAHFPKLISRGRAKEKMSVYQQHRVVE